MTPGQDIFIDRRTQVVITNGILTTRPSQEPTTSGTYHEFNDVMDLSKFMCEGPTSKFEKKKKKTMMSWI
jgi:hypothetical protein